MRLYKIPNRKKKLLTTEFLFSLKNEIDLRTNNKCDKIRTYWGFYLHISGRKEFIDSLKVTCKKHNILKAIYVYAINLSEEQLELFIEELVILMVDRGVIVEGNIYDGIPNYDNEDEEYFVNCEEVKEYKGYNVISNTWMLKEKEIIEEIY